MANQNYLPIELEFDETKFVRNYHLACQNYVPIENEENSDQLWNSKSTWKIQRYFKESSFK